MKAKDDQLWSTQVSEIRADGEPGKRFLTFFTFWFDAAEKMVTEYRASYDDIALIPPTEAMRRALALAENEFGFLDVDLIGQMLCVASMHWAHGEEMTKGLSIIEHRCLEESLARKIADLQNKAKMD